MKGIHPIFAAASSLAAAGLLHPPLAQASDDSRLEEVIVTARRVEESAARLPLALDVTQVTSIGAGAVHDLASLALNHPGLAFESFWGGNLATPILRGLSQPSTAGDNVGVFVDEVYQSGRSALDIEMLDLARIEVVRGPQSALYGHNSFAGAINYVSAQPTSDPEGTLQLDAGNIEQRGVRAAWSQRIGTSRWLARAAAGLRSSGGTWQSLEGETLGGFRRGSGVLTLAREQRHARDDQFSLNIRFNQGRFDHPASTTLDAFDFNCGARGAGPGYWSYYCGHARADAAPSLSPGIPESRSRTWQSSLRFGHDIGRLRLLTLGSYYQADTTSYRDFDGSSAGFWSGVCTDGVNCSGANANVTRFAYPNVVNATGKDVREWAQEVRLTGDPAQRLQWMLGVAGSWTRLLDSNSFGADRGTLLPNEHLTSIVASNPVRVGAQSQLNRALVLDSRLEQQLQTLSVIHQWNIAAFGTLQWPLTPSSNLRVEVRASRESLRLDQQQSAYLPDTSADPPAARSTAVTPRFSIDFAPDTHWYGYLSLARAARSGGINNTPGLDSSERSFAPEYNWTTELAAQYSSDAVLRQARITLYRTDWRNAQISGLATTPGVGTLITTNTAGILARGIEASTRLQGSSPLAAELSFSVADTAFRKGSDDPGSRTFCGLTAPVPSSSFCTVGLPRSGAAGAVALVPYLDGNQSARAPRGSATASLFTLPVHLGGHWQLTTRATVSWQSDVFERPINGLRYGERELLSARATLSGGRWSVAVWGENLTDARYVRTAASRGGAYYPSLPRPSDLLYAEGRRFGITVGLNLVPP